MSRFKAMSRLPMSLALSSILCVDRRASIGAPFFPAQPNKSQDTLHQ